MGGSPLSRKLRRFVCSSSLIVCRLNFLVVRGSIIYNIVDTSPTGVGVGEGGVMVGVHAEDGSQV